MREKKCRLFISIELSEEVRKEIGKFVKKLQRRYWPVRWLALENIHIALAFLGWMEPKIVSRITSHVSQAVSGIKLFEVKIRGIGCFPDEKRPRVVWLGLAGDLKSLVKLQKRVLGELREMGFKMEERKFVPHLTLGRVKRGTRIGALRNLGDQISRMKVEEFGNKIWVNRVSLMESILRKEGPEYRELGRIGLTGCGEKA